MNVIAIACDQTQFYTQYNFSLFFIVSSQMVSWFKISLFYLLKLKFGSGASRSSELGLKLIYTFPMNNCNLKFSTDFYKLFFSEISCIVIQLFPIFDILWLMSVCNSMLSMFYLFSSSTIDPLKGGELGLINI